MKRELACCSERLREGGGEGGREGVRVGRCGSGAEEVGEGVREGGVEEGRS